MQRSDRRHGIPVAVVLAVFGLATLACGQDVVVDAGAPIAGATDTTSVSDPGRATVEPSQRADDLVALDEAEDRFISTVGGNYILTFEFVSSATAEAGPIRVEVVDGRAADVTYPDAISEQILPQIPMLTVGDFFARARSVLADDALVEVEFDESYGYPVTMTFDPIPDAIDDEMSIVVQSVEPVEQSLEADGY